VLEVLCAAVPIELGASLANKATTKLAWESIVAARIGGDRIRRATLQRLRYQLLPDWISYSDLETTRGQLGPWPLGLNGNAMTCFYNDTLLPFIGK